MQRRFKVEDLASCLLRGKRNILAHNAPKNLTLTVADTAVWRITKESESSAFWSQSKVWQIMSCTEK